MLPVAVIRGHKCQSALGWDTLVHDILSCGGTLRAQLQHKAALFYITLNQKQDRKYTLLSHLRGDGGVVLMKAMC